MQMASLVWPPMNALRTPPNLKSTHERHAQDIGSSRLILARSDALIVVISIALVSHLSFRPTYTYQSLVLDDAYCL